MISPTIFISHGGPNILLEQTEARDYLASLAQHVGRPDAIVLMSAHFEMDGPAVVSDPAPGMIYDFGGFPDELYRKVYPAPGDPQLAARAAELLQQAGLGVRLADRRGYDHGAFST
jgi:4,5-DOPA dioxygenase extradiol